ncbi:TIGR00255 family protein [Algoriphagus alkaliphilus]|uniref:TIGR00255 family protein n=1 Tax=Algoriphagus alkaliphilus TaxID=279824 RepID=A0A1G5VNK1_9BACT|nr:YicC/YloC family endoribonuclease [Algoriphagus alkaliphilus]MBA4301444.1 YicC family protein [Cyclobacterium sp.]SDA47433.1 TIGR00255 family protein [Algoriphagus alkaliphilus]
MIKSMTGFGVAGFENEQMMIQIEVRSLNSKILDLSIRSPRQFSDKESEIRGLAQSILDRGKVSVSIEFVPRGSENLPITINQGLFKAYFEEFKNLAELVGTPSNDLFKLALQSPNVITSIPMEREDGDDWEQTKLVLEEALKKCDGFRIDEGASLYSKLEENITVIRSAFERVKQEEPIRKERIRQRIRNHFTQWMDENSFDANRFEQELIYYFEKLDITEELVRLETHLDYFMKSLSEENGQGKKLGFISQEIGREINTIGSKANDAEIQKHVILMKDELEKIKEQSLNVL